MKICHIPLPESKSEVTLCGRILYEEIYPEYVDNKLFRWCKTCKMIFNSQQTRKEDLLK